MKKALALLIFIGLPLSAFSQTDYQRRTSLVGGADCPAAGAPLYRGTRGDFFGSLRVIRNMLGDEAAEYPSWALSKALKNGSLDIPKAKAQLADSLEARKKKASRVCALGFSVETHIAADAKDSLGIPASLSFETASAYASLFADEAGSVIRMEERFPRAGRDYYMYTSQHETEYYFPVSIPHEDITGAWTSDDIYIEKGRGASGAVVDVRYFNWERRERTMDTDGRLLFSVARCGAGEACVSDDLSSLGGARLELASSLLDYLKGKPYKLLLR